jgi:uncharacterized membrane protein YccC
VSGWLRETWDRLVASDPGLNRLRTAGSGAASMASALGVEYVFATVTDAGAQGTVIAMLLGAIVAMMGSMALSGTGVWRKVRTAVFFPVAIGSGMVVGIAVGGRTDLMLGVFVAVMFAAVFVRRFGVPFFFYGFMGWMGYFFASFLHATAPMLPALLEAVVLGTVWVLLLSLTVMRTNLPRTLRRTVRAFDARARAVARAAAELLEHSPAHHEPPVRLRRRLRTRQARLAEVALMVEAWSADPAAFAPGRSAPALRRRLIDAQQAVDGLAGAADALTAGSAELRAVALPVLDRLARRDDIGANRAAYALAEAAEQAMPTVAPTTEPGVRDTNGWWPARHLAAAAMEFIAMARSVANPEDTEEFDEFEPAVSLAMGNLPGSPAVAKDVPVRGGRWNPLTRLDMTTRQAVQVAVAGALAIVAGRELSETRYYWAVIAAFIMFAGTGTRAETFLKGANRVVGTLVGLIASIWLANLTAGSTPLVLVTIVLAMFCGFYLIQISYAYMIFFITIMVGQLYSVLHEFSDGLLVLRLEETAIGAAIGFGVAFLLVPLSTRDTVRSARDNLLTALATLLDSAAQHLSGTTVDAPQPGLDQLARSLDDRVRQLALVAKPLTRPLIWGNSPPRTRHRLSLYAATATHARSLTIALRGTGRTEGPDVACRALATVATQLTTISVGRRQDAAVEPLAEADTALFAYSGAVPGALANDPVLRPLIHLHHLLREIAEPGRVPTTEITPDPAAVEAQTARIPAVRVPTDGVFRIEGDLATVAAGSDNLAGSHSPAGFDGPAMADRPSVVDSRAVVDRSGVVDGSGVVDSAPANDSAMLTGTVTTPIGKPACNPLVLLLDTQGRPVTRARTDDEGRYRIDNCPPGEYVAAVSAPGHQPSATRVRLPARQVTRADLTVGLATVPGATIRGTVQGPQVIGPLRDVTLTVLDDNGTVLASTRTDEHGEYRLPTLPAGAYTLVAAGYPPASTTARLHAGQDHTLHITMRPGPSPEPGLPSSHH